MTQEGGGCDGSDTVADATEGTHVAMGDTVDLSPPAENGEDEKSTDERRQSRHSWSTQRFSRTRRMSTMPVPGLGAAAAHLRAKDIQHINTGAEMLEMLHRVVYGPPALVLLFFLCVYVLTVVLFALLLTLPGESCYRLEDPFDFAAMMWVSVHAFSTIGFGNIAPTQSCTSAQLVILFESFISLLIHSAIGGYVVKLFMRPLSRVRFSTVALVNHGRRRVSPDDNEHAAEMKPRVNSGEIRSQEEALKRLAPDGQLANGQHGSVYRLSFSKEVEKQEAQRAEKYKAEQQQQQQQQQVGNGGSRDVSPVPRRKNGSWRSHGYANGASSRPPDKFITFRMVRQGRVQLRDVRVQMQAQYWVDGHTAFGDRDSHKGRVVNLALEQNYFTTLEQLQVWHPINHDSPLWRMRDSLHDHLDGVEVSVSAFDTASLQQVMFFKRYEKDDIKEGFVFDNTLSPDERKGRSMLLADHSKLDSYSLEELHRTLASASKRRARRFSENGNRGRRFSGEFLPESILAFLRPTAAPRHSFSSPAASDAGSENGDRGADRRSPFADDASDSASTASGASHKKHRCRGIPRDLFSKRSGKNRSSSPVSDRSNATAESNHGGAPAGDLGRQVV